MQVKTVLLAALLSASALYPAFAAGERLIASSGNLGISAEVGGEAISSIDVANRTKFIMLTARLSPDMVDRIRPQVLRQLIDERLQVQEATKKGITVNQDEINQAILGIEAQRNMPQGAIFHMLAQSGIPPETFSDQIKAQILWNKLITKEVRPRVRVSDEEIRLALAKGVPKPKEEPKPQAPQAAPEKRELKIGVIALPVDKPSRAKEVGALAQKLAGEVRGGASFEEVARQFSSLSSSAGGKVETFWVRPEQLDKQVARALANAQSGTVTDALATPQGYTIVKVYDTRVIGGKKAAPQPAPKPQQPEAAATDTEVNFKEILLKLKNNASPREADAMLAIGEEVAKHPGTCVEKGVASIPNLEDFDIDVSYRKENVSTLPPALKVMADTLKVGEISSPFASNEGIRLYMVCGKKEVAMGSQPAPDRELVYRMLLSQKMGLEAEKYIRNLRRDTFIDVRG